MRPDVVAEAEHAFGNLFHRLHYVAQKLQNRGIEGAAALATSVVELEDLLRLVLDYASPLKIEVRKVSAAAVVGSVSASLGRPGGTGSEWAGDYVLADAGHLNQAFGLMRRVLGDGSGNLEVARACEDGAEWLQVAGLEPARAAVASGRAVVPWALAQKLIEAQGGILAEEGAEGGVRWVLRLPLVEGG